MIFIDGGAIWFAIKTRASLPADASFVNCGAMTDEQSLGQRSSR
jgi:hypothetical protein